MKRTKKKISNTQFWSTPIKAFIAIIAVLLILIVPFTIYYEQQQTNITSHAAASTTLAFSQSSVQVSAGSPISMSVTMNPGNNAVSLVQLVIVYDSSMVTPNATTGFQPNTAVFPTVLDGPTYGTCNGNQCTMSISLSVGSDVTKAITQQATIATLNFNPVKQGTTQIAFDTTSQVFSIASSDQANENVLASTTPALVIVGTASGTTPTSFPLSTITPTITLTGTETPTGTSTQSITPAPSGTPEKICKIRLTSKNKKLQKILKSIRNRLDDIDKDLDKLAKASSSATLDDKQLQLVQDLDKSLGKSQTQMVQLEQKLKVSPTDLGGCIGSFDPNNPNSLSNCDQTSSNNSSSLSNAWQAVVNQLQKFFGK